jgi:hypothetical protein
MPTPPKSRRIPIGNAYAATQINATIFRVSAVTSAGPFQYVTYYNERGEGVIARRRLPSTRWESVTLPIRSNVRDAHNGIMLGVSSDGILHVAYDHHVSPLHYRRSARPHDIHSFGKEIAMTGKTERQVTYPQFVQSPEGDLYFFYRDGSSGSGNLCLNRYDAARKTWKALKHPLVDGQGRCNPYWWRPSFGPDGSLHLAWCWRESGDARTNHDICYIRSKDNGETWQSVTGRALKLPLTPQSAPIADRIPMGSNLINQCTSAVDRQGHPHLAHYQNDASGRPQYTHLWHDGKRWVRNVVSHRKGTFSLSGGGTLRIPLSRPEIAITRQGTVYFITRDSDAGGGIRLYRSHGKDYTRWDPLNVTPPRENLGEWEPSYDTARLQKEGVLSLFVLPVSQGNHETVTGRSPSRAFLLEMEL